MIDIIISKVNEVYVKIKAEPHILQELSSHFTFLVPGYKFTPTYKSGKWDGTIKLFSLRTNQIYLGLLPYIEEFCKENKYAIEYGQDVGIEDEFSLYHAKKFSDSLNVYSDGIKIQVNDHQIEALMDAMQRRRALLLSPTSSGKSLIIYMLFRQLLDYQNLKGLVIVPSTALVEQLYSDFKDYSSHNGFNVDNHIHKIYGYDGMVKNSDKKLIVSTWQSLFKENKKYFEQFDYVIVDEAHSIKADSITTIMTNCINAKYRIGVTGTLDGMKTNILVIEGLTGSTKKVITTKELIDQGKISKFRIKCLILKHPTNASQYLKDKTYQDEIKYLISCESRNKFIRNLAISLEKNTLILFNEVEKHGEILYNMIKDTERLHNRNVYYIHGGIDTDDREIIRKVLETENNAILVASFGTFSQGSNVKNLHNLILARPTKSNIRTLQSIGRTLRNAVGKDMATLYDISDDLIYNNEMNTTLNHFVTRVQIYTQEQFPFKTYKIALK